MKLPIAGSVFVIFTFIMTALLPLGGSMFVYGEPSEEEEYRGIGYCASCHTDEMLDWIYSNHTNAYSNNEFQEEWERLGGSDSCLSCHTTGYNEDDGTYKMKGVTCEACHGPGDTMERDTSAELCASCHSGPYPSYDEWKESGPSHLDATCILCHDQHTARLTAETPTGTCAGCHSSHLELLEPSAHGENDVKCEDCHMYRTPVDFDAGTPAETGHSFYMTPEQLDCTTCHDRPLEKHDVLGEKAYACLSCHGEIHGLGLELVNGTVYAPDDPVALCAQCHNERYTGWAQGTHGTAEDPEAKCTECHDPHDPVVNEISTLPPLSPRAPAWNPPADVSTALVVVMGLIGFAVIIMGLRK